MSAYGSRWDAYSVAYRVENPLCVNCLAEGRPRPSQVVDHRVPAKPGTAAFWDPENHQALCKECHDRKTAARDRGFGNAPGQVRPPVGLDGWPVESASGGPR